MSQPIPNQMYTAGTGTASTDRFINVFSDRNPSGADVNYPIQKRWINTSDNREFVLLGFTSQAGQLQADWEQLASGSASTETLTGNSGGAVPADGSNNINFLGDATSINIVGNPGANTLTANVILPAKHTVLLSDVSSFVGVVPSATVGIPLVSDGAGNDPLFTTATVPGGGTGATSFTAYSVIAAGTTGTGAMQNVVGVGTAGQVLTSAGAGALPIWATVDVGSAPWTDQAAPFTASPGNGYFVDAALTATLTASPQQGATIYFLQTTVAALTITANTGQKISINGVLSAAAGTAVSGDAGDSVTLVYRASDNTWYSTAVIGTWNVT